VDMEQVAVGIAGLATAYACFSAIRLIRDHLKYWKNPHQQRLIIYIILMVPLFAVDSLIGLVDIDASESVEMVLDSVKECYEAWVIASFLNLMFSYLNVDVGQIPENLKDNVIHQVAPLNWFLKDWKLTPQSVRYLRLWTMQFVYLRPILSILSLALEMNGQLDKYSTYITIVLNVSVTMAVYALMMCYHAFHTELAPHRPLAQFLCIKGVVFFAFWQGVVLSILVSFKIIHASHWYTVDEVDEGIQNFLVCIEMVGFSFAHDYAFSAAEFKPDYVPPKPAVAHSDLGKPHVH